MKNETYYQNLINDLKTIIDQEIIIDTNAILKDLRTEEAQNYMRIFPYAKPETLISDMFFSPIIKAMGLNLSPQVVVGSGWVDYLIEGNKNPIAIELKPVHQYDKQKQTIKKQPLDKYLSVLKTEDQRTGTNQIVRYLNQFEYVILTNLEDAYYFNREAKINFEPFHQESFATFINDLNHRQDIWEMVRIKEDQIPKHDLDKAFFKDLKKWYYQLGEVQWVGSEREIKEMKILLLNMLIFIQTLEDHALIIYKFVPDTYQASDVQWDAKGPHWIIQKFFDQIQKWFYEYYDTELFQTNIMSYLIDDEDNHHKFLQVLESIIGFGKWSKTHGMGLSFYNYRQIDEDIFGKSYETFLAERRKQAGIYYTPKEITQHMAKKLVKTIFDEDKNQLLQLVDQGLDEQTLPQAKQIAHQITTKTIADLACGSGSFLIKVLREIYQIYHEIDQKTGWAEEAVTLEEPEYIRKQKLNVKNIRKILAINFSERQKKISSLMVRHIYGIDLDEGAIDVAKVNLWKEAIKIAPDHFYYRNLPQNKNHVLPNLTLNLIHGNALVSLPEQDVIDILTTDYQTEIVQLIQIRQTYLDNPFDPSGLEQIQQIKAPLQEHLTRQLNARGWQFDFPLFYPLEFPHLYFDQTGKPLDKSGFDGILGNPPWENIKPTSKEFAAEFPELFGLEEVTKFSIEGKEFKKLFQAKIKEPKVKEKWDEYKNNIKKFSEFVRQSYRLYGSGDLSLQKLFLERALSIARTAITLLIPSNFHTDEGTQDLRREIFDRYNLQELISFRNQNHVWFKDVSSQYKFDIVFVKKEKSTYPFKAKFYITDPAEIEQTFDYPLELIPKLSPKVQGITEFRTGRDVEIMPKIRADHVLLKNWNVKLLSELHMTNDNKLFRTKKTDFPLYEGKMIHQYDPYFANPRYWLNETETRERLLQKELYRIKRMVNISETAIEIDENELRQKFLDGTWRMDYEMYRLVFRDVARSTDERTLISCIIPPNVFAGNTLNCVKSFDYYVSDQIEQHAVAFEKIVYLMALFNSFVLDYYIRLKVSAHVNLFYAYSLPIPSVDSSLEAEIVQRGLGLLYRHPAYDDLAMALGFSGEELTGGREVRAALEILIGRDVFGLSRSDMEYILNTFIYGNPDRELMAMILAGW